MPHDVAPEFSRLVEVGKIHARALDMDISANPAERAALAKRLGLLDLTSLTARVELRRGDNGMIEAEGSLAAEAVQQCVATLEPLPVKVHESLTGLFASPEFFEKQKNSAEIVDVLDDAPEPIVNGSIDIGELVSQHLATALDPYPRKPGVALKLAANAESGVRPENPFAKLAALVKDKDKQ